MTRGQLNELQPGDRVVKDKFGARMKGVVEQVEPDRIFIRYPNGVACLRKDRGFKHLERDIGAPIEEGVEQT